MTEASIAERPDRAARHLKRLGHTVASSFIYLILCTAIVLTTLAYGTVHYWSLALFQLGAALIVLFWAVDGWRSQLLRLSRNPLQWPLLGLIVLGLIQLLPVRSAADEGAPLGGATPVRSLSLDPYSTRLVLVQLVALLIYFAAALAFTDSPRRLRLLVRTIIIFGFVLALFGLIQSFTSPDKIYWVRELTQSTPFGPFINRHHFAGYMELTVAIPLGLLFSGAVERDQRLLYVFAAMMMGVALILTQSRGGIISLAAELLFLVMLTGLGLVRGRRGREQRSERRASEKHRSVKQGAEGQGADEPRRSERGQRGRVREAALRAGLALAVMLALIAGVALLGGESALSRFVGTVNTNDPTTGRAHFWSVTLDIIRHHPFVGTGLGAFGVVYTRYDTRNGMFRLEQAHNDYLQILSDAGIVGAALGLVFVVLLFRLGFQRCETEDLFRRGVATGALAGCFAVLVHSFFDFTLHTTSNALLFLVTAALATINGRVESGGRPRRRRHSQRGAPLGPPGQSGPSALPQAGETVNN